MPHYLVLGRWYSLFRLLLEVSKYYESNGIKVDTTETTDSIHAIINEFGLAGQNAEATSTHISDSLVAISKNMAMD